jgi:hypothetical protein
MKSAIAVTGVSRRYRGQLALDDVVFGVAQGAVVLAAVLVATRAHAWPAIGRFFIALSQVGLTGLLAGLALVLLAGGLATVRRITV